MINDKLPLLAGVFLFKIKLLIERINKKTKFTNQTTLP